MEVDPLASMRIWAVEFDLGGRTFEVPALPAVNWFPLLVEGDVLAVLDLVEDSSDLDDMIITGGVSAGRLVEVSTLAIEQVTGRSIHAAFTLAQVARLQWLVIGGELARRGFRWDEASIGAALDAIYLTIVERLKPEALAKFHTILDSEPAPVSTPGRRPRPDRSKALADFEQMAGPRPTPQPVPSSAGRSGGGPPKTPPPRQRRRPAGR